MILTPYLLTLRTSYPISSKLFLAISCPKLFSASDARHGQQCFSCDDSSNLELTYLVKRSHLLYFQLISYIKLSIFNVHGSVEVDQ